MVIRRRGRYRFRPGEFVLRRFRVLGHLSGSSNHRFVVQCPGCGQLWRFVSAHLANGSGLTRTACRSCKPGVGVRWPSDDEVRTYLENAPGVFDWAAFRAGPFTDAEDWNAFLRERARPLMSSRQRADVERLRRAVRSIAKTQEWGEPEIDLLRAGALVSAKLYLARLEEL